MKRIFLFCLLSSFSFVSFSQEIFLSDSIIYFDKKPIAIYYKELIHDAHQYNVDIYNEKNVLLITAQSIKFEAAVNELKPFWYYEVIFPTLTDTVAVYYEGEAFPQTLARILADYKMLNNGMIDQRAVNHFRREYTGVDLLATKMKSVENYLVDTRNLDEQVVRDRSKPISIIRDRVIMQDSVEIGIISHVDMATDNGPPIIMQTTKSTYGGKTETTNYVADRQMRFTGADEIWIYNGRKIDLDRFYRLYIKTNHEWLDGNHLYKISWNKKVGRGNRTDQLLLLACYLVEDFDL